MYKTTPENFEKILTCMSPNLLCIILPPPLKFDEKALQEYHVVNSDEHSAEFIKKIISSNSAKTAVIGRFNLEELDDLFEYDASFVYFFPNKRKEFAQDIQDALEKGDDIFEKFIIKNIENGEKLLKTAKKENSYAKIVKKVYQWNKDNYQKISENKNLMVVLI